MPAVRRRGCAAPVSCNSRVGSHDVIQICRGAGANLAIRNECLRPSHLSNTTGLVVCAVSRDCVIGIDVENIARTLDADELAPSVFAPAELADFRRSGLEDRRNRFFSYWTLKESYIKARGRGLSLPLDAFWFEHWRLIPTSVCHEPLPRHSTALALLPACSDGRAHDGPCRRCAAGCRAFHSCALGNTDVGERGVGMTSWQF